MVVPARPGQKFADMRVVRNISRSTADSIPVEIVSDAWKFQPRVVQLQHIHIF